jgi:hypothetical protein
VTDYQTQQLVALADRLGTTVEHLWRVLIVQARIEFYVDLFYVGLVVVLFFVVRRAHHFLASKARADRYDEELYVVPMCIAWAALAVIALIVVMTCAEIPSLLLNPEYWALKQVLATVKK